MSEIEIKIFDSPELLAKEVANEFKLMSDKAIQQKGGFNVALSGGSTPLKLFEVLAKEYQNNIQWKKIFMYWADERCVAADNSESNFGLTWKILIDKVGLLGENVHRIFGDYSPDAEAVRYSEDLKAHLPEKNSLPVFDLVLLGIGQDGHTASIFPDQMKLLSSDNPAEVAVHPLTGQKRITLTGKVINNSEVIFFLVTGKDKAEVVKNILERKNGYSNYPATFITGNNSKIWWFLDRESAGQLKKN